MPEAETIDGLEEETEVVSELEAMLDLVNDEPHILHEMLKATAAINGLIKLVNAGTHVPGEIDPVIGAVQAVLFEHGILTQRMPTSDEIADPTWWGHEVGATAETELCEGTDAFLHAAASICEALGVDTGEEE